MIRLRVPGSLTYRHLALRVVSAACRMAAPRGAEEALGVSAVIGGDEALGDEVLDDEALSDEAFADEPLTEEEFEAQTLSAFGEAFNNIAIHGYRAASPGDVDIEIESDEGGIVIQLMDSGSSFDPNHVAVPDMTDLPESGMGLFIINSFMDEVDYRPGSPNVLRLVKRRDPRARAGGRDDDARGEIRTSRGAARAAGAA